MATSTVVLSGFGPHVRFKTKTDTKSTVKVVTRDTVKKVPLAANRVTDLSFKVA